VLGGTIRKDPKNAKGVIPAAKPGRKTATMKMAELPTITPTTTRLATVTNMSAREGLGCFSSFMLTAHQIAYGSSEF
jgi:hypothetical protein